MEVASCWRYAALCCFFALADATQRAARAYGADVSATARHAAMTAVYAIDMLLLPYCLPAATALLRRR